MAQGGLGRRSFLGGVLGLLAAPAIVRVTSIMPVKAWIEPYVFQFSGFYSTVPIDTFPIYDRRIMAIVEQRMNDALNVTTEHYANLIFSAGTGPFLLDVAGV